MGGLLGRPISRRAALGVTGASALSVVLAACGESGTPGSSPSAPQGGPRGAAFNTGSRDVTLFDTGSHEVTGTRPVDAAVRWLSNEQHYFDGAHVWTYDFPEQEVQALAIDPDTFEIVKRVPAGAAGPAHSFVLTPDAGRGFVNAAGSDVVVAIDPASGRATGELSTGAFP